MGIGRRCADAVRARTDCVADERNDTQAPLALVTGATGYIGGRLVPELLAAGYRVRCLARDPSRLRDRAWSDRVEVARGDLTDPESVRAALAGVEVAYYLVHSLATDDFVELDRRAAETFATEAHRAGVRRIVYLGGPQPREERVSPHLASRLEVGRILLGSGVPTAVLRAAVIIGSGSASFEMLRHLTERLPAMVVPRWAATGSSRSRSAMCSATWWLPHRCPPRCRGSSTSPVPTSSPTPT